VVILDSIGETIKRERLKKSLKQYELAEKASISNTYLSDIEVGRTSPSLKTLNNIAKALEIDVKTLL
jgi:transcriptional regulator with XRE-family HTH domain